MVSVVEERGKRMLNRCAVGAALERFHGRQDRNEFLLIKPRELILDRRDRVAEFIGLEIRNEGLLRRFPDLLRFQRSLDDRAR